MHSEAIPRGDGMVAIMPSREVISAAQPPPPPPRRALTKTSTKNLYTLVWGRAAKGAVAQARARSPARGVIEITPADVRISTLDMQEELHRLRDENHKLMQQLTSVRHTAPSAGDQQPISRAVSPTAGPAAATGARCSSDVDLTHADALGEHADGATSPGSHRARINVSVLARTTVTMDVSAELEGQVQQLIDERHKASELTARSSWPAAFHLGQPGQPEMLGMGISLGSTPPEMTHMAANGARRRGGSHNERETSRRSDGVASSILATLSFVAGGGGGGGGGAAILESPRARSLLWKGTRNQHSQHSQHSQHGQHSQHSQHSGPRPRSPNAPFALSDRSDPSKRVHPPMSEHSGASNQRSKKGDKRLLSVEVRATRATQCGHVTFFLTVPSTSHCHASSQPHIPPFSPLPTRCPVGRPLALTLSLSLLPSLFPLLRPTSDTPTPHAAPLPSTPHTPCLPLAHRSGTTTSSCDSLSRASCSG